MREINISFINFHDLCDSTFYKLGIFDFYLVHISILADSELPSIEQKRTEKCVTLNKNNFGSGQLPNNIWYANAYQK